MKYLAVLGRQAEISLAELTALFGEVEPLGAGLAVFDAESEPEIARLGGTLKLARALECSPLEFLMGLPEGKIALALSDYSRGANARRAGAEALKLKKILARQGRSVRVLPNKSAVVSSATAHHNQLAEKQNHVELIKTDKVWWVLIGVQNITAYARRDQARPARDARVGMLPPKLAQILINLCGPLPAGARVLDPFCGTGVVLQEAALMGYCAYGTDVAEKMVDYSKKNLEWLDSQETAFRACGLPKQLNGLRCASGHGAENCFLVAQGDATSYHWSAPINAVACETYLGRPMSQAPAEIKLKEEKQVCGDIIRAFLKNLAGQVNSGTPVVIAVPAWLRPGGHYERLGIIDEMEKLGYNVIKYKFAGGGLLYHREGQVVAREIIVLRKK